MTDNATDDLTLAAEFPPASREDWLKLVRAALKDRPYERLIAKTYDGLAIEPLYGATRDARPLAARSGALSGPWQIMARADHPDPAAANAQALHDLENGATGLALVFRGAAGARGHGLDPSAEAVARLLDGIYLDAGIAIELHTGETSKQAADHVAALVKDPGAVEIRFGHDPIGAHAPGGGAPVSWGVIAPRFAEHVAALAKQGFKSPLAAADGRIVHDAGGSEAQELAYVVSVALAYLRALEGAGVPLDDARTMIAFRLTADADEFLTIAKFRALRLLWARVEAACGLEPRPAFVSAETAWRMMTRRDPYVNMLRTCIAAFSAGVGGANAVTVLPFTAALGLPDGFARRIARNIQLLLLEESNLWRVADPAAGSGAIEDLTGKLARAAWTLFQEIEAAGGGAAALEAGLIQDKVAATRSAREQAVAQRRDTLTGTSDYPLLSEAPVEVLDVKQAAPEPYPIGVRYKPLPAIRLAAPFEDLRDASDRVLAATGARPRIFLANLGTPAEFNARATFAKNLFEAGGIEAAANDGFADNDAMAAAFQASGARLACLCSSDERYAAGAADAARALAAAGASHIYLAGRPKDADALKAAGVGTFVFAGCDALATLRAAHDSLEIGTRFPP